MEGCVDKWAVEKIQELVPGEWQKGLNIMGGIQPVQDRPALFQGLRQGLKGSARVRTCRATAANEYLLA